MHFSYLLDLADIQFRELVNMDIIIGVLAIIGLLVVLAFIYMITLRYKKIKKDTSGVYREFSDPVELMGFIRTVFECVPENQVPMYGFVESVELDDFLQKEGLSDQKVLDVDVMLITSNGHTKVNTSCGDLSADLKRGDFVGVLPIYNDRHKVWHYITIAKLEPIYLGKGKGFLIKEKYTK